MRIIKRTHTAYYTQRTIQHDKDTVVQVHCTCWDDFKGLSVPALDALVDLMVPPFPILVHCSAGVGRSGNPPLMLGSLMSYQGTLLAAYMLRQIRAGNAVFLEDYVPHTDVVLHVVAKLREFRMGLVQSGDQLQLLYDYFMYIKP